MLNSYANAGLGGEMVDFLPGAGYFAGLLLSLPPIAFYGLFFVSVLLTGPFSLGFYYAVGRVLRGAEVGILDFLQESFKHTRRGVPLGLFSVALTHLLLWNVFFGAVGAGSVLSFALTVSRWVSIVLLALLFLALPLICQMFVTTDLGVRAALKNAWILARVYLLRGLLALFCVLAYWWVTLIAFPLAGLITLPLVSFTLTMLIQVGVSWPLVEKHVLDPARRA